MSGLDNNVDANLTDEDSNTENHSGTWHQVEGFGSDAEVAEFIQMVNETNAMSSPVYRVRSGLNLQAKK